MPTVAVANPAKFVAGGRDALAVGLLILVGIALFVPGYDQPLLDGYVDRQCHTAMVARNLQRGGSLLYPTIDVGPFPAYYMLEFPLYEGLVAVASTLTGLPVDGTGRLVSSACTVLTACLLWWILRHELRTAWQPTLGALLFLLTPVSLRYGRAVQPDALMLLCGTGAVAGAIAYGARATLPRLVVAGVALLAAILTKGTCAWLLVSMLFIVWQAREERRPAHLAVGRFACAVVAAFVLGSCWYVHAVASGQGPSEGFWSVQKWLPHGERGVTKLVGELVYRIGWRTLGPGLTLLALLGVGAGAFRRSSFLRGWCAGLVLFVPLLLRKADHEHYYLLLVPPAVMAAVWGADFRRPGWARGKVRWGVALATALGLITTPLVAGHVYRSARRIPEEWRSVLEAAAAVRRHTDRDELIVAAAPVLFYADRRGYAVAHRSEDVRMWAAKWRENDKPIRSPLELLRFYADHGATAAVELYESVHAVPGGDRYWLRLTRTFSVLEIVDGHYALVRLEPTAPGS